MSHTPVRPYVARDAAEQMPAPRERFVLLPPFAHGRAPVSRTAPEIPSIDEFLDHSPPIEQFAPASADSAQTDGEWPVWGGESDSSLRSTGEFAGEELQGYDWGSAARLGSAPPDAAAEAWASTDWSEPAGGKASRQSAAEALARALDQISRRIRAGELRVPGPEAVQDDAAIAATLAALLGIRR